MITVLARRHSTVAAVENRNGLVFARAAVHPQSRAPSPAIVADRRARIILALFCTKDTKLKPGWL